MTFQDFYSFRRNRGLKSKVVDDVQAKFDVFEKRPLTGKFSQMFSKSIHADIDPRLVCNCKFWVAFPIIETTEIWYIGYTLHDLSKS